MCETWVAWSGGCGELVATTACRMTRPRALGTGASRGIGAEVVYRLSEQGFQVVVTARDRDDAVRVAGSLPGDGHRAYALDVTSADSVRNVLAEVEAEGLDVVVNNAAAYVDWTERGLSADLDVARSVMETNLYGPWLVAQAAVPLLRRSSRPRLVNVSSGGGSHGDEAFGLTRRGGQAASYGISKRPCSPSPAPWPRSWPTPRSSSTRSAPASLPPSTGPSRWAPAPSRPVPTA